MEDLDACSKLWQQNNHPYWLRTKCHEVCYLLYSQLLALSET